MLTKINRETGGIYILEFCEVFSFDNHKKKSLINDELKNTLKIVLYMSLKDDGSNSSIRKKNIIGKFV